MSTIIKFFVAADDTIAAGVMQAGPGPDLAPVTYGNFDVWSALEEWESFLLRRDLAEIVADGGPIEVDEDDDIVVLRVPPAFTRALADADEVTLDDTAGRWNAKGEIDRELAREIVGAVATLAATAVRTEGSLYCWVC
ncbi:hypothetical protein QLQ12_01965 [Actinoplanes sp. NEAU-A12]|uniref:Uncharacterized protein n=1 Tax=Actinoplanes sandaracinus TaxID=3045177 RepID=A0ABT6WCG5_9ACTN|nr:hypothetical protein [Actinoplanes sandaracinus]MDI6097367.1 hypothetical protein [Actinoplanes sandaracinus]